MSGATTVEAVYQDGVFKPLHPIILPNNTRVEVRVPRSDAGRPDDEDLGVLAGAFPDLAGLTQGDLEWAKAQWQRGLDHQLDLLDDANPPA